MRLVVWLRLVFCMLIVFNEIGVLLLCVSV